MADASHTPNFRSAAAQMHLAERLYRDLFDRAPLPLLVLTPDCRIVNGNDAYLTATGRQHDTLARLDMFEAFPDSPHDLGANGVRNLSTSYERVLRTGQRDLMPLQRYDIQPENQPWEVRYWHPANWAVLDEAGSVLALVHHVMDATPDVLKTKSPSILEVRPIGSIDPNIDPLLARADAAMREARATRKAVEEAHLRVKLRSRPLIR